MPLLLCSLYFYNILLMSHSLLTCGYILVVWLFCVQSNRDQDNVGVPFYESDEHNLFKFGFSLSVDPTELAVGFYVFITKRHRRQQHDKKLYKHGMNKMTLLFSRVKNNTIWLGSLSCSKIPWLWWLLLLLLLHAT